MRCGGTGSPGDCQCPDCNCTGEPDCTCLSCRCNNNLERKLDQIVDATFEVPIPANHIRGLVREIFTMLAIKKE